MTQRPLLPSVDAPSERLARPRPAPAPAHSPVSDDEDLPPLPALPGMEDAPYSGTETTESEPDGDEKVTDEWLQERELGFVAR